MRRIFDALEIGPDDVLVDFGSGKGRVVFQAAHHPFARVIGVEISPELNRTAERNIERNRTKLECRQIELITADITEFEVPDAMTIAYMYLPVTGDLFRRTMFRIIDSLDRIPRLVKLVFIYPREHRPGIECEEWLLSTGRFELTPESRRNAYDDADDRVVVCVSSPASTETA